MVRPMAVPRISQIGAGSELHPVGQDLGVPETIPPTDGPPDTDQDPAPDTPDAADTDGVRSSDDLSVPLSAEPASEPVADTDDETDGDPEPATPVGDTDGSSDEDLDTDDDDVERLTVQEAARAADKTDRTVRRWVSSGRLPAIQVEGAYLIARSDLEEFLEDLAEAEAAKPAPKRAELPSGLIPIDTVNTIIEEMSRLHRERTEAIERAARAEERERFQAERRKAAEEHLEEIKRLHDEAEAARQAALPPPPHPGPDTDDLSSDSRQDNGRLSEPVSEPVSDSDPRKRPGRVRSAWRVLWASNTQENHPHLPGSPGPVDATGADSGNGTTEV